MQFTKEEELWEAMDKGSMPEIEQLKGKELLDTLEALRTILHPTVRALLESYINAHTRNYFLLIDSETQTRN